MLAEELLHVAVAAHGLASAGASASESACDCADTATATDHDDDDGCSGAETTRSRTSTVLGLRTRNGKSVLHGAAINGHAHMVRALLRWGADPALQDSSGVLQGAQRTHRLEPA